MSVRHLKAALYLREAKNVARAAHFLGRSRTAVSKAVSDLERQVGLPLFDRTSAGFLPTKEGEVLLARAQTIAQIFEDLATTYRAKHPRPRPTKSIPLFTMDIATKRLWQLSLLADHQSIETAAEIAGQSKSTIYKSVHEIEEQLDVSLFARLPDGRMLPIEYGEYLCRQVKLSLSELRLALEDILAIQGSLHGRVTIGCLPSMRPFLLPSTLSKLLHEHPDLSIRIEANPFTQMLRGLLSGDIDVIVGGTRSGVNDPGLIVEELARDRVCIIAPKNHPLAQIERLTRRHLSDARWILPLAGTPSRNIFDNCLRQSGVVIPDNCIETGSITTLGGIMQCDDVLTVGTVYQTHRERANGQLTILPFKLKDDDWPLGVTLRRATRPSISSGHLIDYLRTTVRNAVVE